MNLYEASRQWAERPADQRFWTLEEMRLQCERWRAESVEADGIRPQDIKFLPTMDGEVTMMGAEGSQAKLMHYSFGQVSRLVGAPPDYLRQLPAPVAADCLNHGLQTRADKRANLSILFHKNGGLQARAITSDSYARIWDSDIISRIEPLQAKGWRVPPARPANPGTDTTQVRIATEADCLRSAARLSIGIKPGDAIAPAGLYASDHDMFAFLVNEDLEVENGLFRGFFIQNSEVGDCAMKLTTFLYNSVCGNHIVWDAADVTEIKVVHLGKQADFKARRMLAHGVQEYTEASTETDRKMIAAARSEILGQDKDEITGILYGKKIAQKREIENAYDMAEKYAATDGAADPRSAWGMVQGFTRLSQETPYADHRVRLDKAAGKILEKIKF